MSGTGSAPRAGQRVSILWKKQKEWFDGRIIDVTSEMGGKGKVGYRITVEYDDGDVFSHSLPPCGDEQARFLDMDANNGSSNAAADCDPQLDADDESCEAGDAEDGKRQKTAGPRISAAVAAAKAASAKRQEAAKAAAAKAKTEAAAKVDEQRKRSADAKHAKAQQAKESKVQQAKEAKEAKAQHAREAKEAKAAKKAQEPKKSRAKVAPRSEVAQQQRDVASAEAAAASPPKRSLKPRSAPPPPLAPLLSPATPAAMQLSPATQSACMVAWQFTQAFLPPGTTGRAGPRRSDDGTVSKWPSLGGLRADLDRLAPRPPTLSELAEAVRRPLPTCALNVADAAGATYHAEMALLLTLLRLLLPCETEPFAPTEGAAAPSGSRGVADPSGMGVPCLADALPLLDTTTFSELLRLLLEAWGEEGGEEGGEEAGKAAQAARRDSPSHARPQTTVAQDGAHAVPEPGRRPPGRPPKGMRWDDAKGMYVPVLESTPAESTPQDAAESTPQDAAESTPQDAAAAPVAVSGRRPPGRPPKGMRWDDTKGMYVPVLVSTPGESTTQDAAAAPAAAVMAPVVAVVAPVTASAAPNAAAAAEASLPADALVEAPPAEPTVERRLVEALAASDYSSLPSELRARTLQMLCERALMDGALPGGSGPHDALHEWAERQAESRARERAARAAKAAEKKAAKAAKQRAAEGDRTEAAAMGEAEEASAEGQDPPEAENGEVDAAPAPSGQCGADDDATDNRALLARVRTPLLGADRDGRRYWCLPQWEGVPHAPPPAAEEGTSAAGRCVGSGADAPPATAAQPLSQGAGANGGEGESEEQQQEGEDDDEEEVEVGEEGEGEEEEEEEEEGEEQAGEDEYNVECILAERTHRRQLQYQVKWEGWVELTWEPAANLHRTLALKEWAAAKAAAKAAREGSAKAVGSGGADASWGAEVGAGSFRAEEEEEEEEPVAAPAGVGSGNDGKQPGRPELSYSLFAELPSGQWAVVSQPAALASALARSTDPSDVALLRGLEALKGEATPYAAVTPVAAAPTDEAAAPAEDGRTLAASALGKAGALAAPAAPSSSSSAVGDAATRILVLERSLRDEHLLSDWRSAWGEEVDEDAEEEEEEAEGAEEVGDEEEEEEEEERVGVQRTVEKLVRQEQGEEEEEQQGVEADGVRRRDAAGSSEIESWQAKVRSASTVDALRPLLAALHATSIEALALTATRRAKERPDSRLADSRLGRLQATREAEARQLCTFMNAGVRAAADAWSPGWLERLQQSGTAAQLALRSEELGAALRSTPVALMSGNGGQGAVEAPLQAGSIVQAHTTEPAPGWRRACVAAVFG